MKGSLLFALLSVRVAAFTIPAIAPHRSTGNSLSRRHIVLRASATVDKAVDDLCLPKGLRNTLLTNTDAFSKRIWIVDNSGSMSMLDGHQVIQKDSDCTRWNELQETVACHAQLNAALGAPTDFHLLNPPQNGGPQSFRVGYGRHSVKDSKRAQSIMLRNKPKGKTPLVESVAKIRSEVVRMLPQLKSDGTKVAIVIVTDGCNHNTQTAGLAEEDINQELLQALESLEGLPVSVVVRLCTDYGPLVDFYNGLDSRLEMSFDVLDDHLAEATQVCQHNPWLNYALILHRMREMGQYNPLFDLLDERPLSKDEIREFCALAFGKDDLINPDEDWACFVSQIDQLQQDESMHWNPRTNEAATWIDVEELELVNE